MIRAKTGISGLDELIGGGMIEGSTVLLSGQSGSGKTIFGLQFLYNGITKYNEPGVFVTLETRPNELRAEAGQFGWNLHILEEKNELVIIDAASSKAGQPTSERYALRRGFDMTMLASEIYRAVEEVKAKRLVIDCISALGIKFSEPSEVRNELFRISAMLRDERLNVTSLFISEIIEPNSLSRAGVEQFIAQGLITLRLSEVNGTLERDLLIWKMKQTQHSLKKHSFKIGKSGIEIAARKSTKTKRS